MITQKMLDAAHAVAIAEGEGVEVTEDQVRTVLTVGLPWCMTGIPDAARAADLDLCLVDMMVDAAIGAMNRQERSLYAKYYPGAEAWVDIHS